MHNLLRYMLVLMVGVIVCASTNALGQIAITHGPVLGRLSSDGIGIWVRTSEPGEFAVQLTPIDGGTPVSARGRTYLERDISGWVHISGLQQNTVYDYTVTIPGFGEPGNGGRFTTLPHSDSFRNAVHNPAGLFNFSFEFACGNNPGRNFEQGEMRAFKTMLDQLHGNIHFQIMNGDWIYEHGREFPMKEWQQQNSVADSELPRNLRIAPTMVGVWENYKIFLDLSENLRMWHRNIPAFFVFDDHEIVGDVNGAGTPGLRSRRAAFRDIGIQAWYHYLGWSNPPTEEQRQGIHFGFGTFLAGDDILVDPEADFTQLDLQKAATLMVHWGGPTAGVNDFALDTIGGHPAAGVYTVKEILGPHRIRIEPPPTADGKQAPYSIGMLNHYRYQIANCEFFTLDTRSHRQMHDVRNPWKKDLSMIGKTQKNWLMEGMRASDADFLFVVSSVNFMIPHVAVNKEDKDEAWTVFMEEREQLIEFWDSLGKPVFILTGDLHNSFAIQVTDRVWEFASGPHNSNNHPVSSEGNRPPNGPFEWNGRRSDIRWSSYVLNDTGHRQFPHYCVVQVNNAFNNPTRDGQDRWVAFPKPQVIFQYYDGLTGELKYAESILATGE
jgi:alkaline phosphatase D